MATITVKSGESIQAAIDKANDGDEIIVKKGVYNERLCIEKEITLKGESENRNEMPVVWSKLDDADEENTVTIVYGNDYDDEDIDEPIAVILVTSECTVQNLIVRGLETGTSQEDDFYEYDFDYNKALVLAHGNANFKNIVAQDSRFYGIVTNHKNVAHFDGCEVERTKGVFIGAKAEGHFTNCLLHDNEYNLEMHDYCYGGYFTDCKLYDSIRSNAIFYDGEIEFRKCEIYGAKDGSNVSFQNTPEQRYTNRQDSPWGIFANCNIYGSSYANISSYNPEEDEYDNEGITFSGCEIHDSENYGVSIDNFPLDFCNCKFYNNAKGDVSDDMGLGNFEECEMDGKNNSPDDCIFVIKNGVLEKYKGNGGDVVIPDGVDVIGKSVFFDCKNIQSVTIPDSVVEIGEAAFGKCTSLHSVTIPDGVEEIGNSAFRNCTSLSSVTIPDSVTEIGEAAFRACSSLQSVTISNGITEIGDATFLGCENLQSVTIPDGVEKIGNMAFGVCESLKSVALPNSVTEIGEQAFQQCISLKSVTIPGSVTKIGEASFQQCTSLQSVTISDGVMEIGEVAFFGCENLQSVTIPDSVTEIGECAFSECEKLKSVSIPKDCKYFEGEVDEDGDSTDSFPEWCNVERRDSSSSGTSANASDSDASKIKPRQAMPQKEYYMANGDFEINNGVLKKYKGKGGDVVIPDGVTEIGGQAFGWCQSLTSVVIPAGVTKIGDHAFNSCKSLMSVVIPNGVKKIGERVFDGCESLKSVDIPDSVTEIGEYAFGWCKSLTSVVIPDGVTKIAAKTFCWCESLTSVVIPDDVAKIGKRAFGECKNLKSVSIPNECEIVEDGEYDECDELLDSFPEGCTVERRTAPLASSSSGSSSANASDFKINNGVLEKYNGNGGDVVIPDGVTEIGDNAFKYCKSLTSVVIPYGVTEIGEDAFTCCMSLISVTIPNSVTKIGKAAFNCCESLTSVVIPDGVTEIGDNVFEGCESLTSVVIPDGVTKIGDNVFYDCTSLLSVTIPDSVMEIGKYAFQKCESLESVSIPNHCDIVDDGYDYDEDEDEYDGLDSFDKDCKVERRTAPLASSSGGTSANTSSSGGATTYRIEVSADEAKSGCKKILKYTRKTLCNHCEGAGCASCNGAGVKDTETKLTLNIPAGTKNGTAFSSPEGDYNKSTGKKETVVILVQVK